MAMKSHRRTFNYGACLESLRLCPLLMLWTAPQLTRECHESGCLTIPFSAVNEFGYGPKQIWAGALRMSAFEVKRADSDTPSVTRNGPPFQFLPAAAPARIYPG
jgi:hypothetical protein